MVERIHALRRRATVAAMRAGITGLSSLSPGTLRRVGAAAGRGLSWIVPLRLYLAENYRRALGDDYPRAAVGAYFRQLRIYLGWAFAVMQHGIVDANAQSFIRYGDSVAVLDEAVALGRGVVLCSPHWISNEVVGGVINLRHPVVMLVREERDPHHQAVRDRWYHHVGVQTVRRPRRSSLLSDTRTCLTILKTGAILAVTPDILFGPEDGARPVRLFGRRVHLKAGAAALSAYSGAPMVFCTPHWTGNAVTLHWSVVPDPSEGADDRDALIRHRMQAWCDLFEAHVTRHPEDWLFWLDKRWSRMLRSTEREAP